MICELAQTRTVILSSHILHEVADVCKRVLIINRGEIVASDSLYALSKRANVFDRLVVRVKREGAEKLFSAVEGVRIVEFLKQVEEGASDYLLTCDPAVDVRGKIAPACDAMGKTLLMLRSVDFSLEDVFLRLINEKEAL